MNTLLKTDLNLPGQRSKYKGKVREVYHLDNDQLVMVATDRISAFDVVLSKGIPHKGQILNQIAIHMLKATADIVPNWLVASPCLLYTSPSPRDRQKSRMASSA